LLEFVRRDHLFQQQSLGKRRRSDIAIREAEDDDTLRRPFWQAVSKQPAHAHCIVNTLPGIAMTDDIQ
jgi:hypothetical protein